MADTPTQGHEVGRTKGQTTAGSSTAASSHSSSHPLTPSMGRGGVLGALAERPGGELGDVVGMDDGSRGVAVADRHAQGVGDQRSGLCRVNRLAHEVAGMHVQRHRAIQLALTGTVRGDVGDSQPVPLVADEGGRQDLRRQQVRHAPPTGGGSRQPVEAGASRDQRELLTSDRRG